MMEFAKENWIWIVIIILVLWILYKPIEPYSQATIEQITSKGAQDTYLTQDAWQHLPTKFFAGYPADGKWNGEMPPICPGMKGTGRCWYYPYHYGC